MKYLENLIGEDVWALIGVLAILALGLAIATVATGRGRFLIGIGALACLAIALLAIEWLWVTDRERVDRIIDELAQAAMREDSSGIVQHLAADCRYANLDRNRIGALADAVFQRFAVDKVSVSSRRTEVFPLRGEAKAEFMAVVRGRQNNLDFNPYPTRWILTFVQNSQGAWQVVEIQQIPAFGEGRQAMTPQLP
jgi:hypothetical protein